MHDVNQTADFLAWAGDVPFLVNWQPEPATGRGNMTFKLGDSDFRIAWAKEPTRFSFPMDAVAYHGLQSFAGRIANQMQLAEEAEAAFSKGPPI